MQETEISSSLQYYHEELLGLRKYRAVFFFNPTLRAVSFMTKEQKEQREDNVGLLQQMLLLPIHPFPLPTFYTPVEIWTY